jgi:hypothetical protein
MCLVQPAFTYTETTPAPQPRTMKHADATMTASLVFRPDKSGRMKKIKNHPP